MNRAKTALTTMTVITGLAGLILVTVGAVGSTVEQAANIFTGSQAETIHIVNYGQIYTGAGLLAWAALMLIALLAASMIGTEIRRLIPSPASVVTPEDDARHDTERAARFARAAKTGGLSWSNGE